MFAREFILTGRGGGIVVVHVKTAGRKYAYADSVSTAPIKC